MVCLDDKNIQQILPRLERKVITYGSHTQAMYRFKEACFRGFAATFKAHKNGTF